MAEKTFVEGAIAGPYGQWPPQDRKLTAADGDIEQMRAAVENGNPGSYVVWAEEGALRATVHRMDPCCLDTDKDDGPDTVTVDIGLGMPVSAVANHWLGAYDDASDSYSAQVAGESLLRACGMYLTCYECPEDLLERLSPADAAEIKRLGLEGSLAGGVAGRLRDYGLYDLDDVMELTAQYTEEVADELLGRTGEED